MLIGLATTATPVAHRDDDTADAPETAAQSIAMIGRVAGTRDRLRSRTLLLDSSIALALAALAMVAVIYVQSTLADQRRQLDQARQVARSALAGGGPIAQQARELIEILDQPVLRLPVALLYVLALTSTLPLLVRRSRPMLSSTVIVTSFVLVTWFSPFDATVCTISCWIALYSVAAYATIDDRARWIVTTMFSAVVIALGSGLVRNPDLGDNGFGWRDILFAVVLLGVLFGAAIACGELTRRHRHTVADLHAQCQLLEDQQSALARSSVLDERVRIARELHDVVAHHVSVMGMQAGAARLRLGPDATTDGVVSGVLASIEESSRHAVADLQRLLGFLRNPRAVDHLPDLGPQPSLGSLARLIADNAAAGVTVSTEIRGDVESLGAGVSLSAFRIVQEALTNVRKHAAHADHAAVLIEISTDEIEISVTNPAPSTASSPVRAAIRATTTPATSVSAATGQGIPGMRERVALHGGHLTAGVTSEGGYRVSATLRFGYSPQ